MSCLFPFQILANFDIEAWKQLHADDGVVNSWLCKRSSGDILSQVRKATGLNLPFLTHLSKSTRFN